MGRQLFYDGRGRARLRHRPNLVGLSFTGGRYVTGPLKITYSSGVVNAVEVIGAVPKGAKRPVQATAVAPANHPLSPQRIGRYLLPDGKIIRDDSIKTTAEAQDVAAKRLADGLRQSVDVQFESVPGVGAFLEPGDLCHVDTDDGSVTFRLSKFSLPLVADDSNAMTVGYHRETPLRHTRRHHHHARHHR